jgi:uncharacterized protein DUF2834
MTARRLYLLLAVAGLVVPYYFFIGFLIAHGTDGAAFLRQLFGTPISSFFAVDLLISSIVFVTFVRQECARYAIARGWLYVAALLTGGLSFALPLFLFVRESHRRPLARATLGVRA